MIKITKIPFLFFTSLGIGTVISQINFIPTWENAESVSVITLFAISALAGLFYIIKLWKNNYRNKKTLKVRDWLRSGIICMVMITSVTVLFIISSFSIGQGIFGPALVKQHKFSGITIYHYESSCFPPDNACECDNYYSLVYLQNSYFPIMHLIKKMDFYIGEIKLVDEDLIIKASEVCKRDLNKEVVISLK